jgi:Skp family chaperone for outer membrane proteins
MTQFEFAKEKTKELEKKSNNARNTLTQKGNQLQAAANNFQQKLQNNGFTSREQAEGVQAALQRQQNDLAALQARLENELAQETQKFNIALRDSLNHFLEIYNKDKKYDMILAKSGDNINANVYAAWYQHVYEPDGASEPAKLAALSIADVTLTPAFDADTFAYTGSTSEDAGLITATGETGATVAIKVNGVALTNGEAASWNDGNNNVTITVTKSGYLAGTYAITVVKAQG